MGKNEQKSKLTFDYWRKNQNFRNNQKPKARKSKSGRNNQKQSNLIKLHSNIPCERASDLL